MFKRLAWLQAKAEEGADLGAPEAETPAESSTDDEVNWSDFDSDDEDEIVEGDAQVIQEEEASEPTLQPPPETPAHVEAPVQEAPPTVQASPEPAVDPSAQAESYKAWRTERMTELEKQYALSEDDAVTLQTAPEKVLPVLAAKVHMEVLESSMRAVQAMMPAMLGRLQEGSELNNRAKSLFNSVNSDLADPQYEAAILQFGQVYRSMNKTAPPEEAARAIGNLVRAAYGLVPPSAAQPAGVPPTAPTQGASFVPARGSGGAMRPSPSDNPFARMAEEMLASDDM